ncbi:HSF-type DNA-binding-domain-containing protein, partial [Paraphysoderma sedebokerense]
RMVNDKMYEHLIHWTGNGSSFTVENVTDFSKEVLPKHFKHNNFASFVRQLNMYGFHKVNKAPRGVKMSQENQIWEFSHPKFQYNRPDLLEEIKRKNVDTDTIKR